MNQIDDKAESLARKAIEYLLSSKTILMLLACAVLLTIVLILATAAENAGLRVPYVNDFIDFLKWVIGLATGRNVISDGIMPRVPQAIGANKEPQVAVQSPQTMVHSQPSAVATGIPTTTTGVGPPQARETPPVIRS